MPEWSIGPHSKCGERVTVPGVRIPHFPPGTQKGRSSRLSLYYFPHILYTVFTLLNLIIYTSSSGYSHFQHYVPLQFVVGIPQCLNSFCQWTTLAFSYPQPPTATAVPVCREISKYLEKYFQVLEKKFPSTWKFRDNRVPLQSHSDTDFSGPESRKVDT